MSESGTPTIKPMPKRIIVAFFASPHFGSDWRVGRDYIDFAARNGFDLAVIAELDRNASEQELVPPGCDMRVMRVSWFSNQSSFLYRFTDFLPQIIWHRRVMRTIRERFGRVECIWISTSSAQPWFPLAGYVPLADQIIWGPVGGGGHPPPSVLARLSAYARMRERLRNLIEGTMFRLKVRLIRREPPNKIVVLTRTREVQRRLVDALGRDDIPLFPEFLRPVRHTHIEVRPSSTPRFVWAGQNIPRKDLQLGLTIFRKLRERHFPSATLDVFGCTRADPDDGVRYHGWVPSVDWSAYTGNGVLILSSYREGLSAVLIEAISHGLACIATPVGAIPSFQLPNVLLLSEADHASLSDGTIDRLAADIRVHMNRERFELDEVSFSEPLGTYLRTKGALPDAPAVSAVVFSSPSTRSTA